MSIVDFSWVDGGYHNIFSTSYLNHLTFLFNDWLFWFSKLFLLISGYWGLYLVCVQLGNYLFFGKPGDAVLRTNDWARIRVWIICLLLWSDFRLWSILLSTSWIFVSCYLNADISKLVASSSCCRLLTILLDRHVERVSRRMV